MLFLLLGGVVTMMSYQDGLHVNFTVCFKKITTSGGVTADTCSAKLLV